MSTEATPSAAVSGLAPAQAGGGSPVKLINLKRSHASSLSLTRRSIKAWYITIKNHLPTPIRTSGHPGRDAH
eukprot:scaffold58798_cov78-Phaeocystis_antarctica.AAC.1